MTAINTEGLINKGVFELNPSPFEGPATIAVVGLTRSGTSMIAALLQRLGIFFGKTIDKAVFEDAEFARYLNAADWPGLAEFIDRRNQDHEVWGWKRPNAYRHLPILVPMLRKPRLVVLFRDVLAIAMRNHLSMQMNVVSALRHHADEYRQLVENITMLSCPTLLVSYEKFMQFPDDSAKAVADFCGIELDEVGLQDALSVIYNGPEIYLKSSRLRYDGNVGVITGGKLRGWAMVAGRPALKAMVHLHVEDQSVRTVTANIERKDLLDRKIGDGRCGFEIDIDPALPPDTILKVTAGNANFTLPNSGKTIARYRNAAPRATPPEPSGPG